MADESRELTLGDIAANRLVLDAILDEAPLTESLCRSIAEAAFRRDVALTKAHLNQLRAATLAMLELAQRLKESPR